MQYITSGNRIAVENFTLGDLYTITFTSGTYINSACIGIGENFISFQRNEPELLFTLNMETAELVSSIDLYAGGTGTTNYNELTNKPQISGVELVGNKSLSDLGIQAEITAESPLSSSLVSGLGSAASAESSDFATSAQGALAASAIQSAGTGLTKSGTTLNHSNSVTAQTSASFSSITFDAQGHITGSTAATTAQLNAINSGITSTDVAQIDTNKTNILSIYDTGYAQKNLLKTTLGTSTNNGVTYTNDGYNVISLSSESAIVSQSSCTISNIELPPSRYTIKVVANGITLGNDKVFVNVVYKVGDATQNANVVDVYAPNYDIKITEVLVYVRAAQNPNGTVQIMICNTDVYNQSSNMVGYAPSNAELYEMIRALQ